MSYTDIYRPGRHQYAAIIELWEASVRATHHFLDEAYLQKIKQMLLDEILDMLDLYAMDNNGALQGIMGLSSDKIEMLFVHPNAMGQGIGKYLLKFAINNQQITRVDVNEQNPQAIAFYSHMGFKVTGRSETDGMGKPFPLLEMVYS